MTDVTIEGVTLRLTEVQPSRYQSRAQNRKGYRAEAFNDATGATAYAGSTWRASDGRWYPGHIGTSRKEGPGHETAEAALIAQVRQSLVYEERSAQRAASDLLRRVERANELRAVFGQEPMTLDSMIVEAAKEKTR